MSVYKKVNQMHPKQIHCTQVAYVNNKKLACHRNCKEHNAQDKNTQQTVKKQYIHRIVLIGKGIKYKSMNNSQ